MLAREILEIELNFGHRAHQFHLKRLVLHFFHLHLLPIYVVAHGDVVGPAVGGGQRLGGELQLMGHLPFAVQYAEEGVTTLAHQHHLATHVAIYGHHGIGVIFSEIIQSSGIGFR